MKQSDFLPTVTESRHQLLCRSTAEVTPPSSALHSVMSHMFSSTFFFPSAAIRLDGETRVFNPMFLQLVIPKIRAEALPHQCPIDID